MHCKVSCDGGPVLHWLLLELLRRLYNMLEMWKKIDLLLPSYILDKQILWPHVKLTLRRK